MAKFEIFEAGRFTTWEAMCNDVSVFINKIGREDLISVSQSNDHGKAVIIVWYWTQRRQLAST
jgi:hypothetical protein